MQFLILLNKSSKQTLTVQLCDQLRQAIEQRRIAAGARLPSSRNLADQLAVSRNTVVRAYETLIIEGRLEARPASGIFVTAGKQGQGPAVSDSDVTLSQVPVPQLAPSLETELRRFASTEDRRMMIDFALDQTKPALFPYKMWRRIIHDQLSQGALTRFSAPNDPAGLPELRAAIARYQGVANGILADPAQIIITSGRVESFNLIARMLLSFDARVAMEDPCYLGARLAYKAMGARVRCYPVDTGGLVVSNLPERPTAIVHVTPSHQYPTGAVLPVDRRRALIAWAARNACTIVEDGFGDEFHDEGSQLKSIAATAPNLTIYVGGFASSLGDGLGLGYIIVPPRLTEHAHLTKLLHSGGNLWLEQMVMAEMILSGRYASHLLNAKTHYTSCRNTLVSALRRCFGDVVLGGGNAGLQLFWQLPQGVPNARVFVNQARRARIGVYSLASTKIHIDEETDLSRRGILLGFGALSERQIESGITKLSDALDDALDDRLTEVSQLLFDLPPKRPQIPTPKLRKNPALLKKNGPVLSPTSVSRQRYISLTQSVSGSAMPLLKNIYWYPIKGLSSQPLREIKLVEGQRFPHDREFALARPGVPLQAENPKWAKKGCFVMLMLEEALAKVQTFLDSDTMHLEIRSGNSLLLSVDLNDVESYKLVENLIHELVPSLPAPPTLVRSRESHFMDKPDNVVSLINLATVRDLELKWGASIDPLRFRANLYVDTGVAWEEFNWVGSDIQIGEVTFGVDRRNGRCSATNVNPTNGIRDMDIPGSLRAGFGHKDLGVYLKVKRSGNLAVNDKLFLSVNNSPSPVAGAPAIKVKDSRRFICRGCYYVYHEDMGLPDQGIPPGTSPQTFADSYRCPDCGTDKLKLRPYVE